MTGKIEEELVRAGANGDHIKLEKILRLPNIKVNANTTFAGHTALQAAAQNGHIEVIKVLMKFDVDLEIGVSFKKVF